MTAPLREQLANNATTTLNGGINNSVTSITVTDGSVFPSTGNFRLKCGTELMICTARSTNTLTVTRGAESTTAASHSDQDVISHVLTQGGLLRFAQDNYGPWGLSTAPPLGKLVADDGTTILAASDFTWVNQGSTTATDQNGTILLDAPAASGENIRLLKRTAPSAPYSYIMAMQGVGIKEGVQQFGVNFRQSSSSKIMSLVLEADGSGSNRLAIYKHTNATTYSGSALLSPTNCMFVGKYLWFKIEDDNTNIKFYVSLDGISFVQMASETRTTFFTTSGPDEVGFAINNEGSTNYHMLARLAHWSRLT